ncbi:MAG: phosphohexomutase domain-containing protein [Candidatus Xenobia bacterium]
MAEQHDVLTVSYSGIRGIVGESLTPPVARRFARALGRFLGERARPPLILLGRDNRDSGAELHRAVLSGLSTFPCQVRDLGVCGTPTAQLACRVFRADAAMVITASHNPRHWNGFKFFLAPHCIVMDGREIKQLFACYQELPDEAVDDARPADLESWAPQAEQEHVNGVLRLVDEARIQARGFRVALDTAGGAGQRVAERLLTQLGCTVVPVASPREPEPTIPALGMLAREVVAHHCHFGVAEDMDGDRLVLINERGEARGEDFTLSLAVQHLLGKVPSGQSAVVVKNSSTTAVIDALCAQHGARLVEVPVGEVNLSHALIDAVHHGHPAFGGEGSGGVIHPPLLYGRDAAIGLALTLDVLAATDRPLSELEAALPVWTMLKTKVARQGDLESMYERMIALWPDARVSRQDGLKLVLADGSWLQLRPSNTEPILRATAESQDPAWPQATLDRVVRELGLK